MLAPLGFLFSSALAFSAAAAPLDKALGKVSAAEERYFAEGSSATLKEFASELAALYRLELRPITSRDSGEALSDDDLTRLFGGLGTIAFYTESPAVVKDMQRLFPELERRKLNSADRLRDFNDACLLTHLELSCGLAEKYPAAEIATIPPEKAQATGAIGGRVLDFADDASATSVRSLSWKAGPKILLLTSPGCSPGRLALADIEAEAKLRSVFESHALLIAPTQGVSEAKDIMRWNREHPRLRNFVAYSSADWPIFGRWKTPTFIFLKDGKMVYQFGSWTKPDEGGVHHAKLLRGLRLIGLEPAK